MYQDGDTGSYLTCDTGWMAPFCKGGRHSAFVSVQCCLVVFKKVLLAGHQEFVWIEGRKKEL